MRTRRLATMVAGVLSLIGVGRPMVRAEALDNWHVRYRPESAYSLNAIIHAAGMFVAVGNEGVVFTSADGVNWVRRGTGAMASLQGLTYGNGLFVAVGSSGTILTSPDALGWTSRGPDNDSVLYAVAYANGLFVATGYGQTNGAIWTSSDGMTWTARNSGTTANWLTHMTYGAGMFVVTDVNNAQILTSPDGVNWANPSWSGVVPLALAYGNGTFAGTRGNQFFTSPDGLHWTARSSFSGDVLWAMEFVNGLFIAVGAGGGIHSSPDGVNWTEQNSGTQRYLTAVTANNDTFIAVGSPSAILTSPDAAHWTFRGATPVSLRTLAYGRNRFLAVGRHTWDVGTTNHVPLLTSSDGTHWLERDSGTSNELNSVAVGKDSWIAVGGTYNPEATTIVISTNAVDFVAQELPGLGSLDSVTFGNGLFVAPSSRSGRLATSSNGWDWVVRPSPFSCCGPVPITFANGMFVAVQDRVYTSSDGVHWTNSLELNSILSRIAKRIAFGSGRFVVVGNDMFFACGPTIWTSSDLNAWAPVEGTCGSPPTLQAVVYAANNFVATGVGILSSSEGTNWAPHAPGIYGSAIAYGHGTFLVLSDDSILQSDDTRPRLSGHRIAPDNAFALSVTGGIPGNYRLQVTTNFDAGDWLDLLTFTNAGPSTTLVDTNAPSLERRFYRVVSP